MEFGEATFVKMPDLQRHGAVSGLLYVIVGGEGATNFPRDELHIGFKQLLIEFFGRKLLGAFLQGLIRKCSGNLGMAEVGPKRLGSEDLSWSHTQGLALGASMM